MLPPPIDMLKKLILTAFLLASLASTLTYAEEGRFRTFPPKVDKFGCSVEQVMLSVVGDPKGRLVYTAEAWATKEGEKERWEQSIAQFDPNPKGRRKALKECADWMDEAERVIKKSR